MDHAKYMLARHIRSATAKAEPYHIRISGGEQWSSVSVGWWGLGVVAIAVVGWPLILTI